MEAYTPPILPATALVPGDVPRATDWAGRPWAAFEILNPDSEVGGRLSFHPLRYTATVAGWFRHVVGEVCDGWPFGETGWFVHGHDGPGRPARGDRADDRFQYLPLPSVERRAEPGRVVGPIRRVLVAAPPGYAARVDWVRRRMSGRILVREAADGGCSEAGLLNELPGSDWVARQYTQPARTWATVTPVILPGYDDRTRGKAERLVWQAFEQAGLPPGALVGATAEWRAVGFWPGTDPARGYRPPDMLNRWPRYHVRVRFARPVAGPLAVGAGRYRGFGLFASQRDD